MATSSTCSLMNHCMNCSEAKSDSSRAIRSRPLICSVTRFSCASASSTGATTSANVVTGAVDAGDRHVGVGVEEVLDHHHRVVALLERLAVEERRHLRHRLGVVVDRAGEVLVVGGELVADLDVELLGEAGCGHTGLLAAGRGLRRPSASLFLVTFLPSSADQLALLDRIPVGQRALLEHPQRAAAALRLRDAALRLRQLAHLALAHEGQPNLGSLTLLHDLVTRRVTRNGRARRVRAVEVTRRDRWPSGSRRRCRP